MKLSKKSSSKFFKWILLRFRIMILTFSNYQELRILFFSNKLKHSDLKKMAIYDIVVNLGLFCLVIFVVFILGLYFFQNNLLYMPGSTLLSIFYNFIIIHIFLVIMGSGIPKSSAGNPVGYRNPGEKFYYSY